MAHYLRHYKCRLCDHEWSDTGHRLSNGRCPECSNVTEVSSHEELSLNSDIKFFSVIYSFDLMADGYVGGYNPSTKQRHQWELTERDSEYEYGYMCECEENEPCTCGWRKGKHRKWAALLTPEQFVEFVRHCKLFSTNTRTGGSLGAPGLGYGCVPAIAFERRCDNNLIYAGAYVTPCPEMGGFWTTEQWKEIRQEVIEHFSVLTMP